MISKVRAAKPGHKTVRGGLFRNEMDSDNATSVQPQTQAMGAARRDPERGEIPMRFADHKPFDAAALRAVRLFTLREVVSNRSGNL